MERTIQDDGGEAIKISVGRRNMVITHVDIPDLSLHISIAEIEAGKELLALVTDAAVEKDVILSLNELSQIADAIRRMR